MVTPVSSVLKTQNVLSKADPIQYANTIMSYFKKRLLKQCLKGNFQQVFVQ